MPLPKAVAQTPAPAPAQNATNEAVPAAPPSTAEATKPESAPPSVQQCVEAHERAQVLRIDGRLIASRSALGACAHDACPDPLKHDCVTWREEVSRQIPTVILEALTNQGAIGQATVSAGDRELTRVLDGRPIELDPGHYEFHFQLPDGSQEVVQALVKPGDRNLLVSADFRKEAPTPAPPAAPVQSMPPPAAPPAIVEEPPAPEIPTGSYALGALAVASTGLAVGLGMSTNTKEENSREDCAPRCSARRVDEITTLALLTDISIAVAVSSAVGAVLIYGYSSRETASSVAVQPTVSYLPEGTAYAGIRGSF